MFIHEELIYICNSFHYSVYDFEKSFFFLKLDFDLQIINYHHFKKWHLISMSFDSCEKRIVLLWTEYEFTPELKE
jgi:hypothetical protein